MPVQVPARKRNRKRMQNYTSKLEINAHPSTPAPCRRVRASTSRMSSEYLSASVPIQNDSMPTIVSGPSLCLPLSQKLRKSCGLAPLCLWEPLACQYAWRITRTHFCGFHSYFLHETSTHSRDNCKPAAVRGQGSYLSLYLFLLETARS